jgi:hypothetical protein
MAKVSGGGMTNARALQVLAKIERKLVGYNGPTEKPLGVKKQVQDLIGEATAIENLSQGMSSFHPCSSSMLDECGTTMEMDADDRLCTWLDAFLVVTIYWS